jgi:hypothetical protein
MDTPPCKKMKEDDSHQSPNEDTYDDKNRCIVCKADLGDCNPRQYCRKTYCENADVIEEKDDKK